MTNAVNLASLAVSGALIADANGNVGIGLTPNASQGKLQVVNFSIAGGAPATSGTTDANQLTTFGMGSTQLRFGAYASGAAWIQQSSAASYATNYDFVLQPNAGNVGIGGAPLYKLDVIGTVSGGNVIERIWNAGTATSTQSILQIATGASSERYVNLAVNHTAQYLQNAGVGITALYQDYDTQFFRNNAGTLRATIDSSGNFLVAATTATAKVTIGAANLWTTGASFSGASGNGVWNTGFLSQALNVALQTPFTIAAGAVYAVSDVRVKENIQPIPSGLAFVNAVQPVQFDWKEDKTVDTGYIAQDLLAKGFGHLVSAAPDATMEELVHEDGNVSPAGIRFIAKYDSVVPILHKAIQELKAELDELKAEVAALKGAA